MIEDETENGGLLGTEQFVVVVAVDARCPLALQ